MAYCTRQLVSVIQHLLYGFCDQTDLCRIGKQVVVVKPNRPRGETTADGEVAAVHVGFPYEAQRMDGRVLELDRHTLGCPPRAVWVARCSPLSLGRSSG